MLFWTLKWYHFLGYMAHCLCKIDVFWPFYAGHMNHIMCANFCSMSKILSGWESSVNPRKELSQRLFISMYFFRSIYKRVLNFCNSIGEYVSS